MERRRNGAAMSRLYTKAVNHVVGLGFSRVDAESIAAMELDSLDAREAHYEYILECDSAEITSWIGIQPVKGGAA
jgi:hypothetical protein